MIFDQLTNIKILTKHTQRNWDGENEQGEETKTKEINTVDFLLKHKMAHKNLYSP